MTIAIGIFFLATFIEGLTEYLFSGFNSAQRYLKYVALALGVICAIFYKIDLLASLAGLNGTTPIIGYIISGLIMGRGSNYLNDIISKLRGGESS